MLFYYITMVLVGLYNVSAYPSDEFALYPGDLYDDDDTTDMIYDTANSLPYPSYVPYDPRAFIPIPYQGVYLSKRRGPIAKRRYTRKRATLNQLLQRLVALYGNRDISFSGRSSHVRFGAGGKR